MTRRNLYVTAGAALLLVAAFVAGRYSAPVRTVTETKTVTKIETQIEWRDRVVEHKVAGPVREVERIVETPGAERVITRWIERGPVTTDTDTNITGTASATTDQSSATRTVTEAGRPGWSIGAATTWDPRALSPTPDRLWLELDRRLFGTVWLGVRASSSGMSDPQIGAALRMEW